MPETIIAISFSLQVCSRLLCGKSTPSVALYLTVHCKGVKSSWTLYVSTEAHTFFPVLTLYSFRGIWKLLGKLRQSGTVVCWILNRIATYKPPLYD